MDLRQLRSFVAVAEELSFRRAAERLHLSQPPLSRQIQALETELGVRLLERERNSRISLTDAGRTLLRDAKRTLAQAEATKRNVRESISGSAGELQIANIPSLSRIALPPLLAAFHEQFPQIEVSLVEMEPAEQLAALREKRIHLALFPDLGAPLHKAFESQQIFSCPMVVVLPPLHALAGDSRALDINALAKDTILLPSSAASGYFERFDQLCAIAGFTPTATQHVIGVENILGMVSAGYGVAIFPEILVTASSGTWKTRRLRTPVPAFDLKLVWLRQAASAMLRNFISVAMQQSAATATLAGRTTRGKHKHRMIQ